MVRPKMIKYFGFKSCGRMWYTCGTKSINPDKFPVHDFKFAL
jgi:hypothetical protein